MGFGCEDGPEAVVPFGPVSAARTNAYAVAKLIHNAIVRGIMSVTRRDWKAKTQPDHCLEKGPHDAQAQSVRRRSVKPCTNTWLLKELQVSPVRLLARGRSSKSSHRNFVERLGQLLLSDGVWRGNKELVFSGEALIEFAKSIISGL